MHYNTDADGFLKPSELAKMLQIHTNSVLKMIKSGKITAVVVSGNKRCTYRILKSEIDRYISEQYNKKMDV